METAAVFTLGYHLLTIVGGAFVVRRVKRAGPVFGLLGVLLIILLAQTVPSLASVALALQPNMGPVMYATFYFFVPVGLAAVVVWVVVGGACAVVRVRKT